MAMRLVALDDGPDIPVDREMVVVGRHPQCDVRIDSIRVSRRHCCMHVDGSEVEVRDLGSTNGIRINGQRIEKGRMSPGDELSIAHIRYQLKGDPEMNATLVESMASMGNLHAAPIRLPKEPMGDSPLIDEDRLAAAAAAMRELLPAGMADNRRIQVIVQLEPEPALPSEAANVCRHDSSH